MYFEDYLHTIFYSHLRTSSLLLNYSLSSGLTLECMSGNKENLLCWRQWRWRDGSQRKRRPLLTTVSRDEECVHGLDEMMMVVAMVSVYRDRRRWCNSREEGGHIINAYHQCMIEWSFFFSFAMTAGCSFCLIRQWCPQFDQWWVSLRRAAIIYLFLSAAA